LYELTPEEIKIVENAWYSGTLDIYLYLH
jgi:hypothetical protein